jgi:hypothetical protein
MTGESGSSKSFDPDGSVVSGTRSGSESSLDPDSVEVTSQFLQVDETPVEKSSLTAQWVADTRAITSAGKVLSCAAWSSTTTPLQKTASEKGVTPSATWPSTAVPKTVSTEEQLMYYLLTNEPRAVQVFFNGKITGTFTLEKFHEALNDSTNKESYVNALGTLFDAKCNLFSKIAATYLSSEDVLDIHIDDAMAFMF